MFVPGIVPEESSLRLQISWVYQLESLAIFLYVSSLGIYLAKEKPDPNKAWQFFIYAVALCPIFYLMGMTTIKQPQPISDWLPLSTVIGGIISVIFICIPYLLRGRIFKETEENSPTWSEAHSKVLHLVGIACSVMPSMVGIILYLMGATKDTLHYFVGISYMGIGVWWAWSKHRYSKAANLS